MEPFEATISIELDEAGADILDESTRQLLSELTDLDFEPELVKQEKSPDGAKSLDPILLGTLIVAISPIMLTKFLEFLHAWAMRREDRVIKIKIQNASGALIETEFPATMTRAELKSWISTIEEKLKSSQMKK